MARQADCGRDRLQTLPRHWNGVERQTQDILVGVSLCVCVSVSVCVCVCQWVAACLSRTLRLPVCLSMCVFLAASQLYALFGSASTCHTATLSFMAPLLPPPHPTAWRHAIKFKIVTFDCQLRLLTNIAMIVAMTCGLECNAISWKTLLMGILYCAAFLPCK